MGMSVGGKRGIVSDMNVVPLIDILLVLLVIQVLADGTLRINQEPVTFDKLGSRIEEIFKQRAARVAFIRGDQPVEFGVVAQVIDVMHTSGIASVGLLTPDLEKGL